MFGCILTFLAGERGKEVFLEYANKNPFQTAYISLLHQECPQRACQIPEEAHNQTKGNRLAKNVPFLDCSITQ